MSFSNDGMSPADYAAISGNRNGTGFGSDESWLFVLFLFAMFGGWGNGNWNGVNGGAMPYLMNNNTDNAVQRGFDQNAIISGIQNLQSSITNNQFSMLEGFSNMASAMQNCCCENRLGIANLNAAMLADGCSTRQTISDGFQQMLMNNMINTQNIVNSQNTGFQGLHDKICQLEMDAKDDRIADLERQLNKVNTEAAINAQTATIVANNEAQTTALEQYLAPTARPAYIVQNPNCCPQQYSACGCGL